MRPLVPPDPPLRDADLVLRPSVESDAPAIRELYSEPDIRRWMGWDAEPPDEAEARANIERAAQAWNDGSWAVFRLVDAATEQVVGGLNLRMCEFQTAEVSYFLRASARGRELATRALRLVTRWAFDELGIERVELRVHPENVASLRVAERAGFTREGIERASRAWPDGTRFDSIVFSLLAADAYPSTLARVGSPESAELAKGDRRMAGVEAHSFDSPDETRTPDKTRIEVVRMPGATAARFSFEPGWRWSECIKPVAGTESCQARHVGVVHSGRLAVRHDDGTEVELTPGAAYVIEPGHDAWVVGDEGFVGFEFESSSADEYARG